MAQGSSTKQYRPWASMAGMIGMGLVVGLVGTVVLWGQQPATEKGKGKAPNISPIPKEAPKNSKPLGVTKIKPEQDKEKGAEKPAPGTPSETPSEKPAEKEPAKTAKKYEPLFEGWPKPAVALV
ncbi:MAG: hypothetical protein U0894_19120 [Pirellulales bacterium]